jgi:uridylate kinase
MESDPAQPAYKRILLKVSGEALKGTDQSGINSQALEAIVRQIKEVRALGVEIGLVVGGGNIFRGLNASERGMDRITADHMGMLATLMNSLALLDTLERMGIPARVMSAISIDEVAEPYVQRRAVRLLEKGNVVIIAAGTGNPFFTTDTAASLRAIELKADAMIKATKVDGVYSADPVKDPKAEFYPRLDYMELLTKELKVMDATAVSLLKENSIPVLVLNMNKPGNLVRALKGEAVGTLIS